MAGGRGGTESHPWGGGAATPLMENKCALHASSHGSIVLKQQASPTPRREHDRIKIAGRPPAHRSLFARSVTQRTALLCARRHAVGVVMLTHSSPGRLQRIR